MKPKRIQLIRKKDFDLQAVSHAMNGLEAVSVARPSKWGNPYKVGKVCGGIDVTDNEMAVEYYRSKVDKGLLRIKIRQELAGKNLACFCALDEWCHADVLLKIANSAEEQRDLDAWIRTEVMKAAFVAFHPTSNYGDAMMVLEKCAAQLAPTVFVNAVNRLWALEYESPEGSDYNIYAEGDTLPLAICNYARKLYDK